MFLKASSEHHSSALQNLYQHFFPSHLLWQWYVQVPSLVPRLNTVGECVVHRENIIRKGGGGHQLAKLRRVTRHDHSIIYLYLSVKAFAGGKGKLAPECS
jgi:hypothetical protein